MYDVSATYMDVLSNAFNVQLAYYYAEYAGHTQSTLVIRCHTLVIRRVRCSYADIRWHLWTFVDIPGPKRYSYATHRLNTVSIRYV